MAKKMIYILILITGLSGCVAKPQETVPTTTVYPPPIVVAAPKSGYPPPAPELMPTPSDAYPVMESAQSKENAFRLDKPVYAGDTTVTGHGPAGIPILLVDITTMGNILSETVISDDGIFLFDVQPLEARHRLGIMIGNLQVPGVKEDDFYSQKFYGDEPIQIPQIGFFFDSVLVRAR